MRKVSFVLVGLVLVSALAFAGGAQEDADGYRVGYVSSNFNDTFQTFLVDAVRDYYAEIPEVSVTFQDSQEDVIRQQDMVNNYIAQGVDGLIVVPVNTDAVDPIIRAAQEADVPLVFVNRNPFGDDDPPEGVYYVGSQEIIAGRLQGEAMGEALGGEGGVAILMGILTNEGAVMRTEGNVEVLERDYPGIEILARETGNWQRDQGLSLTENWITAYGDELNGILANNDGMALGAVEALRSAGREDVIVMGVDAIPDALEAVDSGAMEATVLQDAEGQARGAAEKLLNVMQGESVDPIRWVPFVLVNEDNLDEYL